MISSQRPFGWKFRYSASYRIAERKKPDYRLRAAGIRSLLKQLATYRCALRPLIHLPVSIFLLVPVGFQDPTSEHVLVSLDAIEIVLRQLAPLFLGAAP